MELPEGLQELMTLAEVEGGGDVVCLLLQSLYGLKQRLVCDQPASVHRIYHQEVWSREREAKPDPNRPKRAPDEGGRGPTSDDKAKMKSRPYWSRVGSLMYLVCGTRPNISVAVAKLGRFLENPSKKHWDASVKVVRYLLKTKDVGITYDGQLGTQLVAYSDADWAGNRDDRRSVSGVMLLLCGAPVVWRSTFQKTVALSSTETEYGRLVSVSRSAYGCVFCSRTSAPSKLEQRLSTRTIKVQWCWPRMSVTKLVPSTLTFAHFIREKVTSGDITLEYMATKDQLADNLTKGLATKTLRYLIGRSNVGPALETSN
ncbi:unnamed protein product [Phytophthora lilii]|uniref:Unnamed protein product n=1 Tax=Phytophthora lilii TaxID=2077276 RepID=A0A9W6U3C8_9STRA|nr:unnamed protein product [Phytophthora lilii]